MKILKLTKCSGEGCPLKESCGHFHSEEKEVFVNPPGETVEEHGMKVFRCPVYWGEQQQFLYEQLYKITNEQN